MTKTLKKVLCVALLVAVCTTLCIPCGISANMVYGEMSTTTPDANRAALGSSINILTAREINELKMDRVFDGEKLKELSVSKVLSKNSSVVRTVVDVEDYIEMLNSRLTHPSDIETFWAYLTTCLDQVKHQVDVFYDNSNFYVTISDYCDYTLAINNYGQLDTFKDCYTQQFLDDLDKLSNASMTYSEFFQLYGTHVVGEAKFGANLNAWYFFTSKDVPADLSMESGIKNTITEFNQRTNDDLLKYLKNNCETTISAKDVRTAFYAKATGGNQFMTTSVDNFENQYSSWIDSVNSNEACYSLVGFSDGLVPLWELLPENYSHLSAEMQEAFEELYSEAEAEFWKQFDFLRQGN